MKYEVELEIEQHWYPVAAPTDSESAAQAVAQAARMEGLYRARLADASGGGYELFSVPSWGQPVALRRPG
jgi:hypothetical protein